ncbi:MAG: glucose-6-phosphate isomerase [Puniceicoccales bacterium]|jgi:glucose-6-phosphate isomerase|nr:glucose-6-phosphate isomerase [Puniceicoccales bacterium]
MGHDCAVGNWEHFQKNCHWFEELEIGLDFSKLNRPNKITKDRVRMALDAVKALEQGAIANGTEGRRVGHYWLRAPELAPEENMRREIVETREKVESFAAAVRSGAIGTAAGPFTDLLCIGIGGSALGSQLLLGALPPNGMGLHFLDNTDPDGFARIFRAIGENLSRTLLVVTSKSGSTPEPRNGLAAFEELLRSKNLPLAERAVAVTCAGSALDRRAEKESWMARFPMWDWVGGRTSVCSAVGLLPAALCGIDIGAFLSGAAAMDRLTRRPENNPALELAIGWYGATEGRGAADMVVLPYCDALRGLSPYLQQLTMESLGKRLSRKGETVHQGLTVYGNRGSTDQHSYVQQLRDGLKNFFVTFVEVLRGQELRATAAQKSAGEYLEGFFLGTREALAAEGRPSITITLRQVDASSLGLLVALFERAVGFYGEFIDVNAYDQPGVEAGKRAADRSLRLLRDIEKFLERAGMGPDGKNASAVAAALGRTEEMEMVFKWLEFLRAQP